MSQQPKPLTIGVLALQGAYEAHANTLKSLGAIPRLIRTPAELTGLDGLIIPGGESTTMLKFLERNAFFDALQTFVKTTPTFGTCAGAILLAKDVQHPRPAVPRRHGHHRRAQRLRPPDRLLHPHRPHHPPGGPLEMVFIRAPASPRPPPRSKPWPPVTASPSSSAKVTSSPPPFTPS